MDIKIIYEDSDFLVIDKPSGVTVNKSESAKEETIQDWAEKKLKIDANAEVAHNPPKAAQLRADVSFPRSTEEEFRDRGGIVHRLDKETSGILLIAKNPASFLNLQKQFKDRIVKKTYVALVHGEVKPESGEINVPVGRLPFNRKRFGIIAGGRDSVTSYRVISNFKFQISNNKKLEELTLLELYPKTGRTHQIRVHLKYIGHPVFSDPLYGGRKTARNDRKILSRLFLHASKITFNHPTSLKKLTFESPLPEDLEGFLKLLK